MNVFRLNGLIICILLALGCDDRPIGVSGETVETDESQPKYCQVKQVFEASCISCHSEDGPASFLPMHTDDAIEAMMDGRLIIEGEADESVLFRRMTNDTNPMPPAGRLAEENWRIVGDWIDLGAPIEPCVE